MSSLLASQTASRWAEISLDDIIQKAEKNNVILNEQAKSVFQSLLAGENLFLSGAAGTGKSTLLKMIQRTLGRQKKVITLAPTGIAALNVGGQTIHSFFKFKPTIMTPQETLKRRGSKGFANIDLLVIDEISMVRADLFIAIDALLRKSSRTPHLPFGGVQILLIGDLYQLSPIVTRAEKAYFDSLFESAFFLKTPAFAEGNFKTIELTEIYRQQHQGFINMLNHVRVGNISAPLLNALNSRHIRLFQPTDIEKHNPLVLTSKNETADNINLRQLNAIPFPSFTYEGVIKGDLNIAENRLPSPHQLVLKKGARIMMTKNDSQGRWVNGTLGYIYDLDTDSIRVKTDTGIHDISAEKWESLHYVFDEEKAEWVSKVKGSYTQYPLTLAWAMTIHKSQGQTLDACIISLEGGAFAAGQIYVALSRCRSLETLFLAQPITHRDIKVVQIA